MSSITTFVGTRPDRTRTVRHKESLTSYEEVVREEDEAVAKVEEVVEYPLDKGLVIRTVAVINELAEEEEAQEEPELKGMAKVVGRHLDKLTGQIISQVSKVSNKRGIENNRVGKIKR